MDDRKHIEQAYYDRQATQRAGSGKEELDCWGAEAIDAYLRAPYRRFEELVRDATGVGTVILELGAGTAVHSIAPARNGATVIATDISSASLLLGQARADRAAVRLQLLVADAEALPIMDAAVDVVTSAGVLYCLDIRALLPEVTRVLSSKGKFILVDSLNHNFVYRLNRVVGRLRGRRTARATTHIPTMDTIALIGEYFRTVKVEYFGVWTFVWPMARRVLGSSRAVRLLQALEPPQRGLERYAFKVVVAACEPRR